MRKNDGCVILINSSILRLMRIGRYAARFVPARVGTLQGYAPLVAGPALGVVIKRACRHKLQDLTPIRAHIAPFNAKNIEQS